MKMCFAVLLFFLLPKAFADFERPLHKNSQTLEDSDIIEDEKIKLTCFVYSKFVILEKEEPGFLGKIIYYKEKPSDKKSLPDSFCKDIKLDSFKKLESSGATFYGMFRRYLFVQDPDELSARTKFEVYNLESGLLLYSGIKNNNTVLKLTAISPKNIALEYYQRYQVDCDFNSDKMHLKCWTDFLGSVEVPDTVKVPFPVCPKSKNPKKYQVFLKIQVANIQKPKRTFLWSKPICEIAP